MPGNALKAPLNPRRTGRASPLARPGRRIVPFLLVIQALLSWNVHSYAGESLWQHFEVEGDNPLQADGALRFNALQSRFQSPHGHGWRHELKIRRDKRQAMRHTAESLSARIAVSLSPGAKVIVMQYHDAGSGTLAKLYVADIHGNKYQNNRARDGVFDVFLRVRGPDGEEVTYPLITLRSGESFDLEMRNRYGLLDLRINERTVSYRMADAPGVYLKFGNYLQAQDAASGRQVASPKDFADFYARQGIEEATVIFRRVEYRRDAN